MVACPLLGVKNGPVIFGSEKEIIAETLNVRLFPVPETNVRPQPYKPHSRIIKDGTQNI